MTDVFFTVQKALPLLRTGKFASPGPSETPTMLDHGKDEIARAVVFVASNDNSYMTGSELFVDGGLAQV